MARIGIITCANCTQVCPTCFCWDATDTPDLTGKTALVTGATGGIGGAIARALHAQGATVALSGTRREALDHLGYAQIDPINVTGRMHELILRNRVIGYREGALHVAEECVLAQTPVRLNEVVGAGVQRGHRQLFRQVAGEHQHQVRPFHRLAIEHRAGPPGLLPARRHGMAVDLPRWAALSVRAGGRRRAVRDAGRGRRADGRGAGAGATPPGRRPRRRAWR